MMKPGKKLESLIILQEECAEVIQIAAKTIRWDEDSDNNGKLPKTNKEQLIAELGDLAAMVAIVTKLFEISPDEIDNAVNAKYEKLKIYSDLFK